MVCGEDCSNRPRTKDPKGRYYCKPCFELARRRYQKKAAARARSRAPAPPDAHGQPYVLTEPAPESKQAPVPSRPSAACPSCGRPRPPNTPICVNCGVNVATGRSIVTSRGLDEGLVYSNAEQVLRWISWIVPTGILPVASEAMGSRRPYAIWAIAVLTVFVSVWFWFSTDAQMGSRKKLMLWLGNESPSAELIVFNYKGTDWGDVDALQTKLDGIGAETPGDMSELDLDELILEAHNALPPGQQVVGRFRWYQLGTHALLHGDIFHLAGNLLFLLIFGSRVAALIGNIATVVLYPILAVLAALAQMVSAASGEPEPMLGASGAIMGLAGMYFVLFPVNRMHMAAWFRWWFFFRLGMWAMRGFWAVLIYIAFDILYVAIGAETGVAHWAHLGGFIAGGVLALILLLCRLLNAGRGDLISAVLGRHAWKLIGRPSESDRLGLHLPRA